MPSWWFENRWKPCLAGVFSDDLNVFRRGKIMRFPFGNIGQKAPDYCKAKFI